MSFFQFHLALYIRKTWKGMTKTWQQISKNSKFIEFFYIFKNHSGLKNWCNELRYYTTYFGDDKWRHASFCNTLLKMGCDFDSVACTLGQLINHKIQRTKNEPIQEAIFKNFYEVVKELLLGHLFSIGLLMIITSSIENRSSKKLC